MSRSMDTMMKECTKAHPLLHSLAGVGLGLLLVGLMPSLASSALVLGIILIIAGVAGEFIFLKS